jgi:hypothetical protein
VAVGLYDQDKSRSRNIGEVESVIAFHELTRFIPENATKNDPKSGRQRIDTLSGHYLSQNGNVTYAISMGDCSILYGLLKCVCIRDRINQS